MSASNSTPILKLIDVNKSFGPVDVLHDINIEVRAGEVLCLLGDNGAGKSGYARILKRACRARHAGKIEANVYGNQPPKAASADITYSIGGVVQPVERWQDSPQPHHILSAASVFDSDCAAVHIREKNEVAFRPFGLDVPDELAAACQAVKDALTTEQKQLEKSRDPIFENPTWNATTAAGKTLAALNAKTDISKLKELAQQHLLCMGLLGLEKTYKRGCFGLQIKTCLGACVGQEPRHTHDQRLLTALLDSQVEVWPFSGPVDLIEETDGWVQRHRVYNWCYLGTQCTRSGESSINDVKHYDFDLDSYKILVKPIMLRTVKVEAVAT